MTKVVLKDDGTLDLDGWRDDIAAELNPWDRFWFRLDLFGRFWRTYYSVLAMLTKEPVSSDE